MRSEATLTKAPEKAGAPNLVIAFDTWALSDRFRHQGIAIYARKLLEAFQKLVPLQEGLAIRAFVDPGNSLGATEFRASPGFELVRAGLLRRNQLWRSVGITTAALKSHADLIFCPHGQSFSLGVVPVVTTIHDVTPIRSASHSVYMNSLLRASFRISATFSRKILTDSECSKRDLLEIYKLPPEKVKVVHLGYDRETFNSVPADPTQQKALLDRFGIRTPFILHHGTVQPRKNLERLIHAYRLLLERRSDLDLQLVLAGQLGWQYEPILRAAKETGRSGEVVLTGALPDEELASLVKGAALCVVPSLYEGFCLPMVEAMACGVPTIAANTSCLPEVSGGVLCYFDPLSVEDISKTIEHVLNDSALRDELARNGVKRAAEFSWERCARETLDFLLATHAERTGKSLRVLERKPEMSGRT